MLIFQGVNGLMFFLMGKQVRGIDSQLSKKNLRSVWFFMVFMLLFQGVLIPNGWWVSTHLKKCQNGTWCSCYLPQNFRGKYYPWNHHPEIHVVKIKYGFLFVKKLESILYPLSSFPACWQPPIYIFPSPIHIPFTILFGLNFSQPHPPPGIAPGIAPPGTIPAVGIEGRCANWNRSKPRRVPRHPSSYWESYWVPWK